MGILVLVFLVFLIVGLPLGALMLRASVGLANKFLGGNAEGGGVTEDLLERSPPGDPDNPYATTAYGVASGTYEKGAIPEPSFGGACAITLVHLVATVLGQLVVGLGVATLNLPSIVGSATNLIVGFGIGVFLLQAMLPTTVRRAVLVCVCQYTIAIIIGIAVGVIYAVVL